MVHNIKHKCLRIEPPGGKKKDKEAWEQAVAREVKEELGMKVFPKRLFGIYGTHFPEGQLSLSTCIFAIFWKESQR